MYYKIKDKEVNKMIYDKETSIILYDKDEYHQNKNIEIGFPTKRYNLNQIIDILNNPKTFEIINKLDKKEINRTTIYFISNENKRKEMNRNIKVLDFLTMFNIAKPYLNQDTIEQYNQILNNYYLDNYFINHQNDIINITIDNINYEIKFKDIITFLNLEEEQYEEHLNKDTLFGIPRDHFIYTIKEHFETNRIDYHHYLMNDKIKNKIKKLDYIDTHYLNRITKTKDSNYNNITINEEYKQYILKNMPNDLNLFEKVIYIYIKMCKSLTYDEEFFAFNQRGETVKKHQDPKHIKEISLTNNQVVCYEFNAIFGKFLTELGINYEAIRGSFQERRRGITVDYGKGHEYLRFRINKTIYEADAVTSILNGDLAGTKTNQPLVGITSFRQSEFNIKEITDKIYEIIKEEEKQEITEETFELLVETYKKKTNNIKPVNLTDKLNIFIEKINNSNLKGIDMFSYMLHLKNILFTDKEKENNFSINILRENIENTAKPKAIISFFIPTKKTKYFFFKEGLGIVPIEKEEILTNFDNKNIEYIADDDPQIKGIRR